jgi:hypothetical protein
LESIKVTTCHVAGCQASVFPELERTGLCLDHYVDEAMKRLHAALNDCRQGKCIERRDLDELAREASFAVGFLSVQERQEGPSNRERMIELVLGIANLNEFLRRNGTRTEHSKWPPSK